MEGLARDKTFGFVGRSSMELGHLGFFAKLTAKVDGSGWNIGDAINTLSCEVEGAKAAMAISFVPEFKVL